MIKDFNKTAIISGDEQVSYAEMLSRICTYAGRTPSERGAKTIIYSENRAGWAYAFFAIWTNRGTAVPVDCMSTAHDVAYILNDCKPDGIWVSRDLLANAEAAIAEAGIAIPIEIIDDYEHCEITSERADIQYDAQDTALIIYTSGTTGSPKGVMLTFENIFANVDAVSKEVPIFRSDLRTMILLPLHHVLPLLGTLVVPITTGGGVAIAPSMSPADVIGTLNKGKVGIVVGVPRLWSSLYKGIKGKIDAKWVTRLLFKLCAAVGSVRLSKLIFGAVKKQLGGALTYCVSGGAALDKEIGEGMRTLGLDVLEGYGMTEASPIIAFTRPNDIKPGVSGLPLPSVEVKIEDGEVLARGKNIMKGYYNRPEETAEVMAGGWLHTGDLGYLDKKGRVVITGRKKEIIVLSNGKNVNPNEIEHKIENYAAFVREAAVMADGDLLRAIIVPKGIPGDDAEVERVLRESVLEPYNQSVAPYKKVLALTVFHGELPRTRLDKIQRFKLKELLSQKTEVRAEVAVAEPDTKEYRIIRDFIKEEKRIAIKPTDNIELDLAFDSLDKVGLQFFINNTFGMDMSTEQVGNFKNVGEMAAYVSDYKTRLEVEKIDWKKILRERKSFKLPTSWATTNILVFLTKPLLKLYFKLKGTGMENIPQDQPVIIAPNHQSFLDGLFIMSLLKLRTLRNTYFYAKQEHVRQPLVKYLANHHNIIVVDMSNLKDSIQKLAEVLKKKKNVIIFPEGTRTRSGKLGEFKKTFAILSKELNVPIVPVSIKGAFKALPRGRKIPLPCRVQVNFLKPIYPAAKSSYENLTDNVFSSIKRNQMGK